MEGIYPKICKDNLIVRAYIANSETNWKDCLNCGVSVIATDKVSNNEWAEVSSLELFAQRANSPAGLQPEPAADNARMSTKI